MIEICGELPKYGVIFLAILMSAFLVLTTFNGLLWVCIKILDYRIYRENKRAIELEKMCKDPARAERDYKAGR